MLHKTIKQLPTSSKVKSKLFNKFTHLHLSTIISGSQVARRHLELRSSGVLPSGCLHMQEDWQLEASSSTSLFCMANSHLLFKPQLSYHFLKKVLLAHHTLRQVRHVITPCTSPIMILNTLFYSLFCLFPSRLNIL